jgi:hypothetical protein
MPKSKHRRKPGGKAVGHPGRGKPGRPLTLDVAWPEDATGRVDGIDDLPLFASAEAGVDNDARFLCDDCSDAWSFSCPGPRHPHQLIEC